MASSWIVTRTTKSGGRRYRVEFRAGGRESKLRYGGSFKTKQEALARKRYVDGELAALRVPDYRALERGPKRAPTLAQAYERWQASRIDVSAATATYQRSAIRRAKPLLGQPVDAIATADIAELVAGLHAAGRSRETIRKTVTVLAMVLDHAGVTPNPARDRVHVRLPREERPEIQPPSAEHVAAVHALLAPAYQLPLLVLDASGMRVGELEALTWGDVDETRGRWRISAAVAKTRRARWVPVPPVLFDAVTALVARDDRIPERRGLPGVRGRPLPHRHRPCLPRRRRPDVLPARPPAPADQSAPLGRRPLGADRRARRPARPRRDREHVHAHARRRGRARLRKHVVVRPNDDALGTVLVVGGS